TTSTSPSAPPTALCTPSLHDALPILEMARKDETISELRSQVNALNLAQSQANQNTYLINTLRPCPIPAYPACPPAGAYTYPTSRSEEHTSELQPRFDLVCRLLLEGQK